MGMGYGGGPSHPPVYDSSSHMSPGDSGINTKAPSVVADGDLEREDMMDQKRVCVCVWVWVWVWVCMRGCGCVGVSGCVHLHVPFAVSAWCELVLPLFLCSTTRWHKRD